MVIAKEPAGRFARGRDAKAVGQGVRFAWDFPLVGDSIS